MIIILKPNAGKKDADEILNKIESLGLKPLYMPGVERTVIGALGDERKIGELHLENNPAVDKINPILSPYKLVSRELYPEDTVVSIGKAKFGRGNFSVIAGPCAVESYDQLLKTALLIKESGVKCLRGGAFKPRTSPYSFQGLGIEGLKIMHQISKETGMSTVTEVVEVKDVEAVEEYASAFQIGARNMQNFRLLTAVGQSKKPVILKRGIAASIKELLLAAEYIVSEGNPNVILCERGIRTFEPATRNTLDLNAVPYIKLKSHLPIIVDPSHGTGIRELVGPMSKAAIACGADGLIIETHFNPKEALSDGQQSLFPEQFHKLINEIIPFIQASNKKLN
ncbi:MAG: 3-deoxy-7-phosphoheptulonate synthase [bacterium]|nr:3-deoxy-7-phosphoheptulonate synthase [bacterium]